MCKYFSFFEGRTVIKTVINSHALAFHMQSYWWVVLKLTKFFEPNNKNVHPFFLTIQYCTKV